MSEHAPSPPVPADRPVPFRHPIEVRYFEIDQQGVVFNMWYLAYFDDAMSAFLAAGGLPYADLLAAGYDVQLVHSEIDWHAGLRWGDTAVVEVGLARLGRTSFTLQFGVRAAAGPVAGGTTVYVVVATDGSGKRELPTRLLAALGPVAPLRRAG